MSIAIRNYKPPYESIANIVAIIRKLVYARYRSSNECNYTLLYITLVQTIVCYNNVVAIWLATAYSFVWAELGLL